MAENNAPQAAPAATEAPEATEDTSQEQLEGQEEGSEGQEATSDAPQAPIAPKAQAAIKKALKQLKYKVDGKEFQEELPFEIPDDPKAIEYMQRQIQLSKMGQSRAQQAAELQKEVTSWVEQLRKDPKAALSMPNLGIDLKKLAQQVIEEEISNAKKTPEQLEREKLEAKLKSLEDERKTEKEEFQRKEMERLQETAYEQYDMKMTKALETSDLPKSPYVVKKMAEYMLLGLQNNMDLEPSDVLPLVREEITNDLKEMFAVMPDEVVEKLIGKDKINSLRKKRVAQAKTPPPQPLAKSLKDVGQGAKKEAAPGKKQTYRDFFKV